ncbi:MAG: AlkZ family DNA glycosylase [Solirubrobacterales bacterium]|nr:AlkZ family DNA glycosylase [Solirubrobacterales bacterium]MBV9915892.1 AlkZ family DNA glycosylase [Solirubrobacterales bacterium]
MSRPSSALTWPKIHAWRLRRQLLEPIGRLDVAATVRALCGVQAQVSSAAELAVAVRREPPAPHALSDALAARRVLRTWAMRGTLHLLAPEDAPAYLGLVGATRTWERPAWQRAFAVNAEQLEMLAEAVSEVLDGRVLERGELIEEIARRTGHRELDEPLRSGWGAVLKPLAWMGLLCNGPARGNRVTFTSPATWVPGWPGVPEPDEAARTVIPSYLRAHGPAQMSTFDAWLTRGNSRKRDLRRWFEMLAEEGVLNQVSVEGASEGADGANPFYALEDDLHDLAAAVPSEVLRLLPGFDQYVLAPGTGDPEIVAPARRALISKTAGWISPVVLRGGRVVGTWELDAGLARIALFAETGGIDDAALAEEVTRVGACLGRELDLTVTTV